MRRKGPGNVKKGKPSIDRFVQICPNDGPPFLDLCRVYAKAAESLGLAATTVFLSPSRAEPAPADNCYLNAPDLGATRSLAGELRKLLADAGDSLVLCHRYRAYWVFARSGLTAGRAVALAHEHGFFKRRSRRAARLLFGRKVSFAGVSPTLAKELERTAGVALHLPNAVDPDRLEWSERTVARCRLGLPVDGICIGVVGRLHYKKNPELALDSFRRFVERYGPAHLGVVGEGALRQRLEERANGLPVTFTRFVREPGRLVRAFDAVLLTSGAQVFPIMVALEAMAAGVPVVAPRLPDALSVLGNQGCYFDNPDPDSISLALHEAVAAGPLPDGYGRVCGEFSVAAVARRLNGLISGTGP